MNKTQLLSELKSEGFPNHIIKAFSKVKRENFIPKELKPYAYLNEPLPLAIGSTISQPYTIAFMLDLLELDNLSNSKQESESKSKPIGDTNIKILEIGSGSGYVLALINEILPSSKIYGIERIKSIATKSKQTLKQDKNIKVIHSDGSKGLSNQALFDRILISAAYDKTPTHLYKQLKDNGVLVVPVKNSIYQIKKDKDKIKKKEFPGFVFVPIK